MPTARPLIPQSRIARRRILVVTLTCFLAQQWVGTAAAVAAVVAGIVPAANAPANQHPLTDTARNGVPIVDIAPPSAAGVSSNLYSRFNTAANGAILNNSAGNVQTQLGGWIGGNPLLGPTPAKIILNQVTSGNPSQLLGALEVAGQTADVVVANPSGITCNGCSFINTNHATLTTGLPQFDVAGDLSGFNVTQGAIDVGANGLDAQQVERLDLDARDLTVGGGIWAQRLGVVTGAALVPYASTAATAQAGTGTAPLFAVDVAALGGMYANTIDLVATEAGLGVDSQGRIAALQGNLRLSVNGNLTLADTAAQGGLALAGTHVALTGLTQSAGGSVAINASGLFTNTGEVGAASGLDIAAAGLTNSGALVQSGATQSLAITTLGLLANTGAIASGGALAVQAANIVDTGHIQAGGPLALQSGTLSNTGGVIVSHGDAALTVGDLNNANGTIATQGGLTVNAPTLANTGGTLLGTTGADVTTTSPSFGGTIDSQGALDLTVHGVYANTGTLATPGDLNIAAVSLTNAAGATLSSGGNLTATTTGDLTNAGTLEASGSTALAAGGVLTNAGLINSGASTNLTAATLANTGRLYGDALGITAGSVSNAGGAVIASRGDLSLAAATLNNTGGSTILALGNMGLAGGFDPTTGAPTTAMASLLNASSTGVCQHICRTEQLRQPPIPARVGRVPD
jgi:filamentous hemagglutinin